MRTVDPERVLEVKESGIVPEECARHYAMGAEIAEEYGMPHENFIITGMFNPHTFIPSLLRHVDQELNLMRPIPPFTIQQRTAAILGATMTVGTRLIGERERS